MYNTYCKINKTPAYLKYYIKNEFEVRSLYLIQPEIWTNWNLLVIVGVRIWTNNQKVWYMFSPHSSKLAKGEAPTNGFPRVQLEERERHKLMT